MSTEQTVVLKVSLTFDPKALVTWAQQQKGVCCNAPAHNIDTSFMEPELQAQGILAHALLGAVEGVTTSDYVGVLETGIPQEITDRIEREYQASLKRLQKEAPS